MVRDQILFWPWYRRSASASLKRPADFSAGPLHRRTLEILKSAETYHLAVQAALRFDPLRRLPRLRVPTLVCAGAWNPFHREIERLAQLVPVGRALTLGAGYDARRRVLADFLGGPQ